MNERDIDYVLDTMKKMGFERNLEDSELIQSHCNFPHFNKNLNVYLRRSKFPVKIEDA